MSQSFGWKIGSNESMLFSSIFYVSVRRIVIDMQHAETFSLYSVKIGRIVHQNTRTRRGDVTSSIILINTKNQKASPVHSMMCN